MGGSGLRIPRGQGLSRGQGSLEHAQVWWPDCGCPGIRFDGTWKPLKVFPEEGYCTGNVCGDELGSSE